MKLQQLHMLLAVVDEGGIRAAARRLNLSQAAVTKAMRSLEEEGNRLNAQLREIENSRETSEAMQQETKAKLARIQELIAQSIASNGKFNIGSINKAFTQIAINQLIAEGKLKKSDTLGSFFPDYPQAASRAATVASAPESAESGALRSNGCSIRRIHRSR